MLADINVLKPEEYQRWLETKTVRAGSY